MICPECRDDDHAQCEDAKHPHRVYRGCACQHATRQQPTVKGTSDDHTD